MVNALPAVDIICDQKERVNFSTRLDQIRIKSEHTDICRYL